MSDEEQAELESLKHIKIECLKELEKLSERADFRKQNFTLDGFILTSTKKEKIPGAEKMTWEELRRDHCLLSEDGVDAGALLKLSI